MMAILEHYSITANGNRVGLWCSRCPEIIWVALEGNPAIPVNLLRLSDMAGDHECAIHELEKN